MPPPGALDADDRVALSRVENYLNDVHTLRARFVQQSAQQGYGRGTAWIERPGRLRLQYDPPSQALLVAARGRVVYSDAATGGSSSMPLSRTPLAILLAERIVLSGPVTVVSVRRTQGLGAGLATGTEPAAGDDAPAGDGLRSVEVTLRSTEHPGQGQISLSFSDDPLRLRGLVLVDGRGDTTQLSLSGVQVGAPTDDALFRFGA